MNSASFILNDIKEYLLFVSQVKNLSKILLALMKET